MNKFISLDIFNNNIANICIYNSQLKICFELLYIQKCKIELHFEQKYSILKRLVYSWTNFEVFFIKICLFWTKNWIFEVLFRFKHFKSTYSEFQKILNEKALLYHKNPNIWDIDPNFGVLKFLTILLSKVSKFKIHSCIHSIG